MNELKPVMPDYVCPECGSEFQHYNITFDVLNCVNGHKIPTMLAVPKRGEETTDGKADDSGTQEATGE